MFCTECGQPLRPADKFCARCGTPNALLTASSEAVQSSDKTADKTEEGASAERPVRTAQSTLNVGVQPSVSGTASFHTGPVGPQSRRSEGQPLSDANGANLDAPGSEASNRGATRVSSVFSYRERPSMPVARAEAPECTSPPASDQPLIVNIPATPDLSHEVTPANPVIATQSCPACGALNDGVGRFCEICGTRLDSQFPVNVEPPRASPDLGPLPPSVPAASAPIRSAFTDVAPDAANVSYADDVPESRGGSRVFWIIVATLLVLGLGAIVWMLRSQSRPSAAPLSTNGANAITVTPALGSVAAGNSLDLTATLSAPGDPDVTWSVQENGAVGRVEQRGVLAKGGKLSAAAVYVAGSRPGVYHVIATSKADPSQFAVAEITVTAPQ